MVIKIKLTRPENVAYHGLENGSIVSIDIEEYLGGVVPSEVYESRTGYEALKAQAIAARTYAVYKHRGGVTMDDTANSQAYRAPLAESSPRCLQAVRDTAGKVLLYGGNVIQSYYSRSNGGITKRTDQVWSQALPYYRNHDDPWDTAARKEAAQQGKSIKESHGVGLSQVGAEYAAKIGISCEEILAFYYPGTGVEQYEQEGNIMAKPKASAVCATSIACAKKQPPIPYVWGKESATQQDCQGHVEFCVRENGGTMGYAGSNDMFRNACSWVGTLAEAKANGYYIPGALLFQVKSGGDYPEKYHADGKGNAQHIGYLIGGIQGIEIVHASSSAGKVTTGTMSSSWTHLGLAKAIDYSEYLDSGTGNEAPSPTANVETPASQLTGIVTADRNGLNMRATPGGDYMLKIPTNAQITLYETVMHDGELWGKTQWHNAAGAIFTGWVLMSFVELRREEATAVKMHFVVIPVSDEAAAYRLMGLYKGSYLMEVGD